MPRASQKSAPGTLYSVHPGVFIMHYAKKDRITHRIPIASLEDIDDEVKNWLKVAYDLDA
jgi:hypothetical protein